MVRKRRAVWAALVVVGAVFAAGCGADDGLAQAEVDEAIAEAIAGLPESAPGLTAAEIEEAIRAAIEELPSPEEGVSMAEVQEAIQDAIASSDGAPSAADSGNAGAQPDPGGGEVSVPSKSDPAAYTRHFVESAIAKYDAEGLGATLAHYNSPDSVDGQWYLFIVDRNGEVIGHYDPSRLGLSLRGWVGTDVNGYEFGTQMLSAPEEGQWVGYVYRNPDSGRIGEDPAGDFELKNAWVVRHDGLLFASGWYIPVDEFTSSLVDEVAERLRTSGLEATIAYFNDPQSITAGLREAIAYYNSTDTADGTWLAFFADSDGTILSHNNPAAIGGNIADLLGPAVLDAPENGAWITEAVNPQGSGPQSMRVRAIKQDGIIVGTGWYQAQTG